mmetsp:Transcript_24286/g.63694  ORF Transcript_24286/g.63694 Transcript_24286/m.63694 type:complete len:91 (-) Transcript_24286:510-782(-)
MKIYEERVRGLCLTRVDWNSSGAEHVRGGRCGFLPSIVLEFWRQAVTLAIISHFLIKMTCMLSPCQSETGVATLEGTLASPCLVGPRSVA